MGDADMRQGCQLNGNPGGYTQGNCRGRVGSAPDGAADYLKRFRYQ
jgi:hypothetical protein